MFFSFLARINKEEADNLRVDVRATALCMCFGHCIIQCVPSYTPRNCVNRAVGLGSHYNDDDDNDDDDDNNNNNNNNNKKKKKKNVHLSRAHQRLERSHHTY